MTFIMPLRVRKEHAELMGYDAETNGADTANCHFSIFATSELTRAWELGKKRGAAAKRRTKAPETSLTDVDTA